MQQKGERMEKDQIKAIIKDLRSKGLSFQKISDILRESYSVDISYATVRLYFKESIRKASVKVQNDIDTNTNKIEPIKEANPTTIQELIKAQVSKDNVQVQNNVSVQSVHNVRYPGFEDEDLKSSPFRDHNEMTPEQRYQRHLEWVKQNRKERNKSIALFALLVLTLVGIAFALKYRII